MSGPKSAFPTVGYDDRYHDETFFLSERRPMAATGSYSLLASVRFAMPTCPGCRQQLSHENCLEHLRYCKWVWSDRPEQESRWNERLVDQIRKRER
ncbi:hypothetical protein SAMN04489842_1001 [Natronobacterium texcoconense]|uniref:Uncharacterized protein n=1 Tax=Natronobacterium texcoconense TaxID=1095778 RepID=A0A1H1BCS1_NATTX|nr:hypothetical protein SAMN04489842_1001 [Natronobacterium texcoconense]